MNSEELRVRLGKYLLDAWDGETIIVTRNGQDWALLQGLRAHRRSLAQAGRT